MSENYQVLITGANRGLGLEFTKQYAKDGWRVLACCRVPKQASALQELANTYSNIQIFTLDVADFAQVDALAQQLKDEKIDVLINNAGIYPDSSTHQINTDDWLDAFTVNSISPYKIATAFTPHIAKSSLKKIATLTSKMGSIDDNTSGGSYIYRSSKAAANMVMKSLATDLQPQGISVVILHPGWVQTDMGGSNALIDTKTSVAGMRRVIEYLKLSNTGCFIAYDGQSINW
ncbi:SDR family oxidoreductase [Methylotenera mobilis]|uniref:Short-chain dehydrogenase/reductase SDR n=1 Tax=Methylotenera mobilis (strain JLW8 / ATCC BAA-1282 / DSM 17540) TaxID=583345 RepID=C6WXN4_METML|nr:SDR family oxidoreductase [Methylotenera mobilis]ACT48683.1 short-chain dehydrogenase/reductase SDR [Methylotenera mobilis JLW8]